MTNRRSIFRIALAVLDLLSDAATASPLLLVAEDAHWLDQPSLDVLSFVARRLESDPIVLLAAVREGYPAVFGAGELPELRPQPLDPESAKLQIAQLAARGLSNREIGQRLYVSHRTISTHLYRIFPKLGITARGELRDALSTPTTEPRRRAGVQIHSSS